MAGKIRHIAFRVDDIPAVAEFFRAGFGMTVVQERPHGAIDLSDGTINITLLPSSLPGGSHHGIDHLGFTFEDDEEAKQAILAAGGTELNTVNMSNVHFEVKFQGPEGIVVDLGHWAGTAPVAEEVAIPAGS
jgi:catechol 2,3-dioxygenase-like lactoylglutathione lyase family enzyme